MKLNYENNMVQHGEVLLVPVESVPEGFIQAFEGKEYIVGHSETGHHHTAVAELPMTVYKPIGADSDDIYLRVQKGGGKVLHQKAFDVHETKTLNQGVYLVRPKTEFDLFANIQRKVVD